MPINITYIYFSCLVVANYQDRVFLISTSALKPEEDLGAARDIIRDLVSGQSNFISGIWPSNALKNIWATLLINDRLVCV
jgi:hypothetical protein